MGKQVLRRVFGCFYADVDLTASASWNQKCTLLGALYKFWEKEFLDVFYAYVDLTAWVLVLAEIKNVLSLLGALYMYVALCMHG